MIVVMGAAGETSRRIIQYAREQGVSLRLAARDPEKMRAALGDLTAGFDTVRADATDSASVEAVLDPGDVLLNATTPAGALGHGLARAAIARGAHYTSFTGEIIDSMRLREELHESARARGVTLCPGTGYAPAMGDFALRLALSRLPDAIDGYVGYSAGGFTPSYGTLVSEMHIMDSPGLVIRDGVLRTEDLTGSIFKVAGKTLVGRPLMDPLMVSTYSPLKNYTAATEIPNEYADAVAEQFKQTAAAMRSAAGRATYMEQISAHKGKTVTENTETESGYVTAYLFRGDTSAQGRIASHPIYEQTARCALLVARELAELRDRPAGFQAASSIVRSIDYAVASMGNTIVS